MVERKHRHILEVARAVRFQGGIPIKFWGECVLAAVYLINRIPTPVLKGKLPYEVFHGHKANISHLRTLGCLCYATKVPKADKFSPRADACVLMGYSLTQKGYRLYNLVQKKFTVSRDVVFKENFFPFRQVFTQPQPLFPADSITLSDDTDAEDRTLPIPMPAMSYSSADTETSVDHSTGFDLDDTNSLSLRGEAVSVRRSSRTSHPPI